MQGRICVFLRFGVTICDSVMTLLVSLKLFYNRSLGKALISAALSMGFAGCSNEMVAPPISQPRSGLSGNVVDSSGNPLDSVRVYCLFYSSSIPVSRGQNFAPTRVSGVDTFAFRLYQNFPNPFSHSTFVRFSLPSNAEVVLTLKDPIDGSIKYTLIDTLQFGLYQIQLYHIGDSLRNGPYTILLEATGVGGLRYSEEKELFVISDSSIPADVSDRNGSYVFDYRYAFVGDSVISTSDGEYMNPIYLTNEVQLLFQRMGYRNEIVSTTLFANILLRRDVVLTRDD